jgi:hypothetical protein
MEFKKCVSVLCKFLNRNQIFAYIRHMKDIKQFKSERWRMNLGGANVLSEKPRHCLVNGLAKAKTQNPTFYFLTFFYFLHHINHFLLLFK